MPDIVETLLPLLSNSNRTRRQVVTQLVHMRLVGNAKELKKPKYVLDLFSMKDVMQTNNTRLPLKNFCHIQRKGTGIVLWTEEQELELQMLFEEYRDSDGNRYSLIFKRMTEKLNFTFHLSSVPNSVN